MTYLKRVDFFSRAEIYFPWRIGSEKKNSQKAWPVLQRTRNGYPQADQNIRTLETGMTGKTAPISNQREIFRVQNQSEQYNYNKVHLKPLNTIVL